MKDSLRFPKHPFPTHGGADVPHCKNTENAETVRMPAPKTVTIPLSMHIGAPCAPLVKVGDTVYVGTKIADSSAPMSAPIHSSVSGTVSKLVKLPLNGGRYADAIVITSDGLMTPDPDIQPPKCDSKFDLIAAVRDSGLVGLGGAGFPTAVKLQSCASGIIDTLIINGAECEPYITADYREAMENSWDIMSGVFAVQEFIHAERVIIAIEENKPKAIEELRRVADNSNDPADIVRVLKLKSSYPQGAEKILVQACTGRVVPMGGLPADVGCMVMNLSSVAFIARYLKTGMPLVERRMTVDGSAVEKPGNVFVPIGTSVREVLEFCGLKTEPKKVLLGGPMMGFAIPNGDVPLAKQNNAVLAFAEDGARRETACIRCGKCVGACPMKLTPLAMERKVEQRDAAALQQLGVMNCIECGSCAYVCPAGRQLVQSMRMGKNLVREAGAKKK